MAIDDNTSYELTGRQVKDLANKVKAKADSASLASVATSGLYSDLTGAPAIPTVYNGTLTIQQNGTSVGTFTANASSNATISLTDTTYSAMIGASSGTAGTSGLVPAPAAGDESKVLSGAGTWVNQSGGSTYTAGNGINISANDEISIDTITTSMIADGAVTAAKVVGGTSASTLANGALVEIVGTTTGDNQNYCLKYADGRMVAVIRKAFSGISFSAWGSCYEHEFSAGWLGNYAVSFKSKPIINVFATCTVACWALTDAGLDNESLTSPPRIEIVRPASISGDIRGALHCVAYGFWK